MDGQGLTNLPLSTGQIAQLRQGYQPDMMKAATRGALARMHPGGAPYVASLVESLYSGQPLSAADREKCLLALLASRQDGLTLAVHVYWGLMEGITLDEVAQIMLLAGAYQGIPVYAASMLVLDKTCQALAALVAECPAALQSGAVLQHLIKSFPR